MKSFIRLLCYLIILSSIFSISSCQDELACESTSPENQAGIIISNTELKKEFGAALAKVLAENSFVRELIKNEAIKQFDYDYDVLYLLIKDKVMSDNTTLEENMLRYITPKMLALIEERIPTITIFVPELPENTFSAELWNITQDIPHVGIRTSETNDVPAFDSKGNEYLIESQYIPAYPIVVVKTNERVVKRDELTKSRGEQLVMSTTKAGANVSLSFLDDSFDNYNKSKKKHSNKRGG